MKIKLIAAMTPGTQVIGKDNALPWRLPSDLKRFKELTAGKPIIMGRKTYESIGRPLPNRTNIVLTTDEECKIEGCLVVNSIDEALGACKALKVDDVMVIGGAQVYDLMLYNADELLITYVLGAYSGDVIFPPFVAIGNYPLNNFELVECSEPQKGEKDDCYHVFCRFVNKDKR